MSALKKYIEGLVALNYLDDESEQFQRIVDSMDDPWMGLSKEEEEIAGVVASSLNKVSPSTVVDFLNELIANDADTLQALIDHRVPCSQILSDHPTVQCADGPTVGLLGLLNGLCGTKEDGRGYIEAFFDGEKLVGFKVNSDT